MNPSDIKQPINNILPGEDVIDTVANRPHNDLEANIDSIIQYIQQNPASNFDVPSTLTGLSFPVSGGVFKEGDSVYSVNPASLTLDDDTTNYVFIDTDQSSATNGTVISNTTGFTTDIIPLYEVVTAGGSITSVADKRAYLTRQMQFSGNGVLVTDAVTGEIVEHPTVDTNELATLNGITPGTPIESRLQGLDNAKLDKVLPNGPFNPNGEVLYVDATGAVVRYTNGDVDGLSLATLDSIDKSQTIQEQLDKRARLDGDNIFDSSEQTIASSSGNFSRLRLRNNTNGGSSLWFELYDDGYSRINIKNTNDAGTAFPNARFEIIADGSLYRFQNGLLSIDGSPVVTTTSGTAYNSNRLGGAYYPAFARRDVDNTFNGLNTFQQAITSNTGFDVIQGTRSVKTEMSGSEFRRLLKNISFYDFKTEDGSGRYIRFYFPLTQSELPKVRINNAYDLLSTRDTKTNSVSLPSIPNNTNYTVSGISTTNRKTLILVTGMLELTINGNGIFNRIALLTVAGEQRYFRFGTPTTYTHGQLFASIPFTIPVEVGIGVSYINMSALGSLYGAVGFTCTIKQGRVTQIIEEDF